MRLALLFASALLTLGLPIQAAVTLKQGLSQPEEWYGSKEALELAQNVLQYQIPEGGWPKNTDMSKPPSSETKARLQETPSTHGTIDNGGTTEPLRFLAKLLAKQDDKASREAFLKGIDYLLAAQYPNGGWPQFYPLKKGYHTHITFNDNAMINVMRFLREIAAGKAPNAWLPAELRAKAASSVERGVACILKCQVEVAGVKTGWCAQHDEFTFAPAKARAYEHPSLSGAEGVGIVEFLMSIEKPSPQVIASIEAAIAWFEKAKLTGIAVKTVKDPKGPKGFDRVVVKDPSAKPLWARFYEVGTNRPIFSGRDSVIRYEFSEIEIGRRTGYSWYSDSPNELLEKHYPKWKARLAK